MIEATWRMAKQGTRPAAGRMQRAKQEVPALQGRPQRTVSCGTTPMSERSEACRERSRQRDGVWVTGACAAEEGARKELQPRLAGCT